MRTKTYKCIFFYYSKNITGTSDDTKTFLHYVCTLKLVAFPETPEYFLNTDNYYWHTQWGG